MELVFVECIYGEASLRTHECDCAWGSAGAGEPGEEEASHLTW